jgi:pimeloyl-ACP methyl ester carboxylesterase
MIGSPMDGTGFAGLAAALAGDYTVVTYDLRGIGNSSREDTSEDVTPEQQADDVHRLLLALGDEPASIFGSSGGPVVGLALVTAHPDPVRTLVAHEPPLVELLPDNARLRAQIEDIYDTYRTDGAEKAMQKVHGPCRPGRCGRPGGGRSALGTFSGAAGPDARHHRPVPCAPASPDHALPARHRGAAGGVDARRGRRRGHVERVTSCCPDNRRI